jgi:PBP1b-binding outer membrane lipoprotein LpoB
MMKKIWGATLALAIVLGACSNDQTEEQGANEQPKEETETVDVKKAMMNFYMEMTNTINENDTALNTYREAMEKESSEEMAQLKEEALTSAEKVVEALQSVTIPTELNAYEETLKESLETVVGSYDMIKEELTKEAPSFEAADAKFMEADEKIASVLEEVGLHKSSLYNDVNM